MTFNELRAHAGHTYEQAAAYLYCSLRTVKKMAADDVPEPYKTARLELYRLKLEKEGRL